MIANPFAILDGLVAVLRLPLGVMLTWLAAAAWLQARRITSPDDRSLLENRCYLLMTLAVVVQWLNVLSWPLFYLTLQSYVIEWPGVMCIYGVTQIGVGSAGSSGWLPALLLGLQLFKPALVLVSGAWAAVYQIHRRSRTGPLLARVLLLLCLLGVLAAADAAAELTYLVIPKKNVFPWSGCCTDAIAAARRAAGPLPLFSSERQPALGVAFACLQVAILFILMLQTWRQPRRNALVLPATAALALSLLFVGFRFLSDVLAPQILRMPDHACPYDLLPRSPWIVAAMALHFLGCVSVGWANFVYWLGHHPETAEFVPTLVRRWLRVSLFSYLLSLAATGVALWVA